MKLQKNNTFRRIVTLGVALVLLTSLVACSNNKPSNKVAGILESSENISDFSSQENIVSKEETSEQFSSIANWGNSSEVNVSQNDVSVTSAPKIETLTNFGEKNNYTKKELNTFLEKFNYSGYSMASFMLNDQLNKGNVNAVISPISIYQALGLASIGADGNTKTEFEKVLLSSGYTNDQFATEMNALVKKLTEYNKTAKIDVANSLWIKNGFPIKQSFIDVAKSRFNADVFNVDFTTQEGADARNNWVLAKTKNLLNPEIKPDEPNPLNYTVLSIINTIYYKNSWSEWQFGKDSIKSGKFTCENKQQTNCDFLNTYEEYGQYVDGDGFISAQLKFMDGAKMTFILPDKEKSVANVLKNTEKLSEAFDYSSMKDARVYYKIPKFKVKNKLLLNDPLKEMGMKDTFNAGAANFGKLVDLKPIHKLGQNIYVSTVNHGVSFELNEFGVEAAAYTEINFDCGGGAPPEPPTKVVHLDLDRPFIYTVHDRTGSLLFIGVMNNPKA